MNNFKFKKAKNSPTDLSFSEKNSTVKRFFSKRANTLIFALFLVIVLSLVFFYCLSTIKPSFRADSIFYRNLPSSLIQIKTEVFTDYSQARSIAQLSNLDESKIQPRDGSFVLTYNAFNALYKSLKTQGIEAETFTFWGTDSLANDHFVYFVISLMQTFLAFVFAVILSSVFGIFLAFYVQNNKLAFGITKNLFLSLVSIPSLILSIIFFNIFGYSTVKFALFIFIIFTVQQYLLAQNIIQNMKQKEYYLSALASGYSRFEVLKYIVFKRVWIELLLLYGDLFILSVVITATSKYFDVKGVENSYNLGSVFRNVIENKNNTIFLLGVMFYITAICLLFQLLSNNLSFAFKPYLKRENENKKGIINFSFRAR
ncbi:ABC transporter permease [Mycoplasma sp. Ms02]|uniref:ABC transporter permease n=1 Tax=Mycoplasma sp. Ms02 TaxID=353851 RepID=UPI001C8A82DC|nr:ABC transporter permease subunit [Mycoplasma sp. Ms02]QZE12306.1 hypothetical protein K4L35_03165 [Mycoplasma sp. Ms02]